MKYFLLSIISITYTFASTLQESEFFNYDVFFTNPVCETYKYDEPVYSIRGKLIDAKPKNVYCKRGDFSENADRETSPHYQLIKLINDKNIDEMFLTFLSFSNSDVANNLCNAIKERNLKVTFIIDSKNLERDGANRYLEMISECKPEDLPVGVSANIPKTFYRGNTRGLGYAHNKIILAKYKDSKKVSIVFGSANMSSGTILHHENWHFVTTSEETYFYQAHECLKEGMLQAESKSEYKKFINKCRSEIEYPKETDIDFFIVPSDGKLATRKIINGIKTAKTVDIAVHRFTHTDIIKTLVKEAKDKKIRLVADDDIYWTGVRDEQTGSNMFFEYNNIIKVVKAGVEVKYMETNQNSFLLHHNKYMIFNFEDGSSAVHAGAGNFTKAAFSKNFENFYYIKIPSVVKKFKEQYEYVYKALATAYIDMPVQYVMP